MTKKETLTILLGELLEKVEEVKDYIIDEFDEDEREEEEIKDYLEMLTNVENTIIFYN